MSMPRFIANMSLRLRFVIPISALLIASMFIVGGYLIDQESESFHRELVSKGEAVIKILALNAESGVLFESKYELDDLLVALTQFSNVEFCRVINLQEKTLSQIGYNSLDPEHLSQIEKRAKISRNVEYEYIVDKKGKRLIVFLAPISTEKQVLNREALGITGAAYAGLAKKSISETIGWMELRLSVEMVNQAIGNAKMTAILLTLLVVILAIMVIAFIVNAVTRPVTELVDATDRISRGDYSISLKIDQQDEIGHLAKTFTKMAESLEQSRAEIEQYNRTLEEKIIERTEQLEQAQAQLVQSEKLGAIGQLAAGVAHELNNPLGGILGYAQFTLEKLRKNIPEKTQGKEIEGYIRYVGDIETQARRCKNIVQNLLRFARSSRTIEFDEVDVNAVITETVSFVEHQVKISQMTISINLADNIPTILGNSGQLQQVFTNLIINSMHASEPNSDILIKSRFSPSLGEFKGAVEISVNDSGHGIAQKDLKKIFEPFFTTKEVGKGTGLGLSVSYGIIHDHGGEITATSEIDKGTTFTIVLPVQESVNITDIREEVMENKDL